MAKGLRQFLLFLISFFGFWMVFFTVFRIVFLLYHRSRFQTFGLSENLLTIWHGWYMDISMSAYFCLLPVLIWLVKDLMAPKKWIRILSWYQLLLVLLVAFLLTVDLEIFQNWGHRLDSAILPYLQFPKEAIASSASSPIRILFTIFGLSFVIPAMLWAGIHVPFLRKIPDKIGHSRWWSLAAIPVLVVVIRGGLQLAPMNQSSVYFSSARLLNQAAENGIWVFIQSVLQQSDEDFESLYAPFPQNEVNEAASRFWPQENQTPPLLLSQSRPNIVLVVWESLTAKVVGHLNGGFPSTPNLDNLTKSGIVFENLYANGDRSDKGLVSLLSGLPALGKLSIMFEPNLAANLPFLPAELKKNQYQTAYFYGGDLGFANMKSYMVQAGFETLTGDHDFPKSMQNSKWGAHDEAVFAKELEMADMANEPFFHTIFTLSSHEPFEVPGVKNKPGESMDSLFCHSHRYTDQCLGQWLAKAQSKAWWPNTLLIVVADHGHTLPGQSQESSPEKYHIPMVWYGPVLKSKPENLGSGLKFSIFGNQSDLAKTLLNQLQIPSGDFIFSRDLLGENKTQGSIYAFRNGMSQIGPDHQTTFLDGEKSTPDNQQPAQLRQVIFERYFKRSKK